mmetsp:Transcript_26964/g.62644  ORF Transcript_26964/g.62644 Transcript_26964/m.62644 type:complete len:246 (-) Transcript_26964:62-799(-)
MHKLKSYQAPTCPLRSLKLYSWSQPYNMHKPVIILGACDLGSIALDILQQNDIVVYGFLDDNSILQGKVINDVPVLGSTEEEQYFNLIGEKCDVCMAIEKRTKQQRLATLLREQKQVVPINAIHPSVIMATSVTLGYGNLVNVGGSIGPNVTLGNHCVLHTHVTIEHGALIKDFVQVGAGSVVGASVKLNEQVFVGAGVTIVAGAEIGAAASIGAGSVVLSNVKPGETVLGNPAKAVKRGINGTT